MILKCQQQKVSMTYVPGGAMGEEEEF